MRLALPRLPALLVVCFAACADDTSDGVADAGLDSAEDIDAADGRDAGDSPPDSAANGDPGDDADAASDDVIDGGGNSDAIGDETDLVDTPDELDGADLDTVTAPDTAPEAGPDAEPDAAERSALDELLDALRTNAEAAMTAQQAADGWPARVEEGWLFVSRDAALNTLAGDFNDWTPAPMTAEGDFWWVVSPAELGDGYKFTNGILWEADPWARTYTYDGFGELSTVHASGERLERHLAPGAAGIPGRELRVYVPAEAVTHLLYAHDGQNLFDPGAFHGGWRLQETAPEAMMVVGIDNSSARFEEYTAFVDNVGGSARGGSAERYLDWIEDVVRPLVRSQHGEPEKVGMIGSSLGGLLVLYAHAAGIGDFDFVAALSPSVSWGSRAVDGDTILSYFAEVGAQPGAVYVDSGGGADACVDSDSDGVRDDDPTETDGYCTTLQLAELLDSLGYTYLSTLWHWWEPGALHNEAAWAARVARPMQVFAEL